MKTYTTGELKAVLDSHKKWAAGDGGSRAYLSGAHLSGAKLSGANLSGANLSSADLSRANLCGADLYGADLSRANLSGANLYGANLYGAYLYGADLSGAYLSSADLSRANLYGANLSRANLSGANLCGADLYGADLSRANLSGALNIPPVLIQPEEGGFFAWKKLRGASGDLIAKLWVPAEARRINSFISRKCRAEYVEVVSIVTMEGVAVEQGLSPTHGTKLVYRVGQATRADNYEHDFTRDCAGGIHYFMTRKEAEDWK